MPADFTIVVRLLTQVLRVVGKTPARPTDLADSWGLKLRVLLDIAADRRSAARPYEVWQLVVLLGEDEAQFAQHSMQLVRPSLPRNIACAHDVDPNRSTNGNLRLLAHRRVPLARLRKNWHHNTAGPDGLRCGIAAKSSWLSWARKRTIGVILVAPVHESLEILEGRVWRQAPVQTSGDQDSPLHCPTHVREALLPLHCGVALCCGRLGWVGRFRLQQELVGVVPGQHRP
mmetsp:Transcript_117665/g.293352  ORF Transcript_117665/g.293352 Transcript_117665/m.293352 type:complete len:230 (+) Transcript_117665:655-1344(+)